MAAQPSTYTESLADRMLQRIAEGETVRAICRDDDMPARSTFYEWVISNPALADRYARAREMQAHAIAEQGLDDATGAIDPADVAAARLAFDARKWFAAKVAPKVYGDRVALDVDDQRKTEDLKDAELEDIAKRGRDRASEPEGGAA